MIARTTAVYGLVAGTCLLLHNATIIAANGAGAPLLAGVLLSFAVVALSGYALHSRLTFREPMRLRGLLQYGLAMSANVPLAFATTWVWHTRVGMPMIWAAPLASACMVAVNFVLTRWAVAGRRGAIEPGKRDMDLNADGVAPPAVDERELQAILAAHLSLYRGKVPHYQALMLSSLRELWQGRHRRLLDVGGGTGAIAEAMARLFPVDEVQAIDVVDRFCPTLSVGTAHYDGRHIPFADGYFDAATLNNVVHHVPVAERAALLREIRRTVAGPVYIKDHERRGAIDHWRLTALDAIGNIPFGGMLWARYLTATEWQALADEAGYRIAARARPKRYRAGPYALIFPNRLEVAMRFDPA
jgi:2-polyprenyl-3-methyl-5-hydroxy-6-metoxy-1,4-benzoquinol methylase/putative flippase GtrA